MRHDVLRFLLGAVLAAIGANAAAQAQYPVKPVRVIVR